MSFQVALAQVLVTLLYIVPGYLCSKMKKASPRHLPTLGGILVYVCGPALHTNAFLSIDYSPETLKNMAVFFLLTLILQSAFMAILYAVFRKKQGDSRFRILNIGSVLGNVGFFGLPVIRALLPAYPEVACYSAIYSITMNILVFTMGVFCLTGEKKYMSVRSALLNPTMISFFVAVPLFLMNARRFLPSQVLSALQLLGGMSTPLCMFVLGVRLSQNSMKKLFSQPFVYAVSFLKLLLFPLFCFAAVCLLPLSMPIKASVLILSATPCASVILSLAELHQKQMDLAASCVLVSTLLCFMTIPVMTLLV
ncbi:MAG: AEC family transporter [Clostridia bacterium]|nr:AEC family transporter [Clostridia bacterium]